MAHWGSSNKSGSKAWMGKEIPRIHLLVWHSAHQLLPWSLRGKESQEPMGVFVLLGRS